MIRNPSLFKMGLAQSSEPFRRSRQNVYWGSVPGSGTFDKLSELSKTDFTEAGKCIAFERYTAAAFHVLRGTEQALTEFYLKKVKRRRIKKNLVSSLYTKNIFRKT